MYPLALHMSGTLFTELHLQLGVIWPCSSLASSCTIPYSTIMNSCWCHTYGDMKRSNGHSGWVSSPEGAQEPPVKGIGLAFLKKDFIYFREGKGGREGNIKVWLTLLRPLLGTWPATQACAPTGEWTGDPLICRLALNHWITPATVGLAF